MQWARWLPTDQPVLMWVAIAAASLAAMTGLLVLTTLLLRVRLLYLERRRQAFIGEWRPILMEALIGEPAVKPISRVDEQTLLLMWNHLHESLRGDAKDRLNAIARRIGLPDMALRFMNSRSTRRQLIGVFTLGNLHEALNWDQLARRASLEDPYLSVVAMRSLVQIDPARAAPLLVRELAHREDWASMRVATLLNETDATLYVPLMVEMIPALEPTQQVRLLRYMAHVRAQGVDAIVNNLLGAESPDVVGAALQLVSPMELGRIRDLTRDRSPVVRLQAAVALGRLGSPGDDELLVGLLNDSAWWVRYRAAQSLTKLPFFPRERLDALRTTSPHAQAREILDHVLAEGGGSL